MRIKLPKRLQKLFKFKLKKSPIIPRIHIKMNNGQFEVMGMGAWHSYWRDPYHLLLTIPWPGFLLIVFISYSTSCNLIT